jgi:hypothetical protein
MSLSGPIKMTVASRRKDKNGQTLTWLIQSLMG